MTRPINIALCFLLAACCEPSGRGCPDNRTAAEKTRDDKQLACVRKNPSNKGYEACMRAAGFRGY